MAENADETIVKRFKKTDEVLAKYGLHLKKSKLTRKILNEPNSVRKSPFLLFSAYEYFYKPLWLKKPIDCPFFGKNCGAKSAKRSFSSKTNNLYSAYAKIHNRLMRRRIKYHHFYLFSQLFLTQKRSETADRARKTEQN